MRRLHGVLLKVDVFLPGARACWRAFPKSNKMTRIQDGAVASRRAQSISGPELLPRGTHRAGNVPGNYHSNLLLLTGLPTIKHYELPSALILPG